MSNIQIANSIDKLIKIDFRGERVLTTKQMAEVYGTEENNIKKNLSVNKERFIEGNHYYLLKGYELKEFKRVVTNSNHALENEFKFVSQLTLWTEKGANRMCKILDTDKAWEQFEMLEETYFNVKWKTFKPLSPTEMLEVQLQALKENKAEIQAVNEDLQHFKVNIPLFGNEQYDLQKLVRSKGTSILGGREARAYKNKSLRQRLYSDLQGEIKRQFGVNTYKAIKRSELEDAKEIIKKYTPPLALKNEIVSENYKDVYGDLYDK